MTSMTTEEDIGDDETATLELREDIFFTDTDSNSSRLSEMCYGACKECAVFDRVEYTEYLLSQGFTMFSQKM